MIKLLLIVVLAFALQEPVSGKVDEQFLGNDGYYFLWDYDSEKLCNAVCLDINNSRKVARALLYLLHANEDLPNLVTDIRLVDFMYRFITYNDFAEHIKANDFSYEGYARLKVLVSKFRVCGDKPKVLKQFRMGLASDAADTIQFYGDTQEDGTTVVSVYGNFILLSEIIGDLENLVVDPSIRSVQFHANVMIADANMEQSIWHGQAVDVTANLLASPYQVSWDVSHFFGEYKSFDN